VRWCSTITDQDKAARDEEIELRKESLNLLSSLQPPQSLASHSLMSILRSKPLKVAKLDESWVEGSVVDEDIWSSDSENEEEEEGEEKENQNEEEQEEEEQEEEKEISNVEEEEISNVEEEEKEGDEEIIQKEEEEEEERKRKMDEMSEKIEKLEKLLETVLDFIN